MANWVRPSHVGKARTRAGGPSNRMSPVPTAWANGRRPRSTPPSARSSAVTTSSLRTVLERLGFRRSRFPVYPINQHAAEKLHALTLPRDAENTRARDLVDLAWFIRHFTFRSEALAIACIATFERRATHSWPPVIDAPPESWTRPYGVWRAELDLAQPTAAVAVSALRAFFEPVYFGIVGMSWDPIAQRWMEHRR